jgi:hypothetical protein
MVNTFISTFLPVQDIGSDNSYSYELVEEKKHLWNDIYYTDKDKHSIFHILSQWEKEIEGFSADTSEDQQRLHAYIN